MGLAALRRYYRAKAEAARAEGREATAGVFEAKLEALEGTPIPEGFPAREKLTAAGLRTLEDVMSALEAGRLRGMGLTRREVEAVRGALGG